MQEFIERLVKNPKTTLEGFVWGAVIVAGLTYVFGSFKCSVPPDMNWLAWGTGLIAVVRGAMSKAG